MRMEAREAREGGDERKGKWGMGDKMKVKGQKALARSKYQ